MVLVPIAREVFRQAVRSFGRYYNLESKAFNKLYTGFPRSKLIGRGVRHGLTAGSITGTFINKAEDTPGNGIQKPFSKQTPTRQPYKTRRGFPIRRFTRCPRQPDNYSNNRYSNTSNHQRNTNRLLL